MPEPTDTSTAASSLLNTWMRSVNDFWSAAATETAASSKESNTNSAKNDSRPKDHGQSAKSDPPGDFSFWKSGLDNWQAFVSSLTQQDHSFPKFPDTGTFQETFFKMSGPVFSAVNTMISDWQQQAGINAGAGQKPGGFTFDQIDKDALGIWRDIYDNGFRKFLKIPQLGLMREHQEKVAGFFDHFNLLEAALAEFLGVLSIPFKKSLEDFHQKLTELAATGKAPTEPNDYYKIWLRILEGQYMTLFQSPDYVRTLSKTLAASAAYTRAKKELTDDVLRQLSIPSSDAMDALYQELHALKKRIKHIEKEITSDRQGR